MRTTELAGEYEVLTELEKHTWADLVLLQSPVNWMGVPWSAKKYMDEVYSAGMDGTLCHGDGRTRSDAAKQYGSGGTREACKYMLSLTFNAPKAAFSDSEQFLFQGKSIDDLFLPMHMNFRFFGMTGLPTFACLDVMKNPRVESDFVRFEEHLRAHCLEGGVR